MTAPYVEHGTQLMVLKPSSVLAAAEADIKHCQHNTDPEAWPVYEYAFHRLHVRRAMRREMVSGTDIIREALRDLKRGLESGKPNTRLLYSDEALLRAAIGDSPQEAEKVEAA